MADEGFQEIQLTGKQVVFLFMATTVIAAGIFLAGVLVGRGVQAEKATGGSEATLLSAPQVVPESAPQAAPVSAAPVNDPAAAPAPPPTDELSYYQRLQGDGAANEKLKGDKASPTSKTPTPAAEPVPASDGLAPAASSPKLVAADKAPSPPPVAPAPAPVPPKATASASAAKPEPPKTAPPAKAAVPVPANAAEPPGDGFVVQVAAVRDRAEADAILKHLQGKGYSAFMVASGAGSPASLFRVRVGKFKVKSEADAMAKRLEKEEQYKPWVTR